jgi:hypothetical protein
VRLRVKGTSTVVSKIGKTTTTPIDRFVALYCVKGACDGHSLAKVDGDYFRSFTLRNLRVTSRGEEKIEIEALRYKYTYNRKANTFEVYVNSDSADGAEIEQLSGKCQ